MNYSLNESILQIVLLGSERLRSIKEPEVSMKSSPTKWSKKEILGHLIDSACNNHQRFVLAQYNNELHIPSYNQTAWVKCQNTVGQDWLLLVDLWNTYNRHLAYIISQIPQEKLSTPCWIGEGNMMTLDALIRDYIRHLEHHLKQLDKDYVSPLPVKS